MATNYEKMQNEIGREHNPFIVYDIETTGIMNGLDNRITQVSLVAYDYNKQSGKYELQNQLFMLAKPDEQAIRNIQAGEKITDENIAYRLARDFSYSLVKNAKSEMQKLEKKLAHDEKHSNQYSAEELADLRYKVEEAKITVMNIYETRKTMFDRNASIDEIFSTPIVGDTISPQVLIDCHNYISQHYDEKKKEMEEATSVADTLAKQGLDLEKYIADSKGLTTAEMQIGITEFLVKYHTMQTAYVNNGTYFANHYMQKEGLTLFNYNSTDKTIDLIQAQRSMHGGSVETFAENYKKSTGKEIKTFDALTKGLCMGEIVVKGCNMSVSLASENYLKQKVAETAMSMDNDYVMSNARASAMNWLPASQHAFDIADFHSLPFLTLPFHSLEYVNFGNDRRYVDIDKMFEMNDNFEITLEGEKEPIKTWEELETKIKALNSEISNELLDKIHEKYNEVVEEASDKWKADVEKRYEEGSLLAENMTKEQYEYLDDTYDLSYMYDRYLIDRKIHGELESVEPTKKPIVPERQQTEALFEELAKLRRQKTDIQNANKEDIALIFQSFGEKINSYIEIYSENVRKTNYISFPIGNVDIFYDKSVKFSDKNGCIYDRNSTGVWNLIRENEISVDNIEKAFWKYMTNVAKEQIVATQKEVNDLQERSYVLNEMKSFTKADVSVDKNKTVQKGKTE